jgi:hypothetical protein
VHSAYRLKKFIDPAKFKFFNEEKKNKKRFDVNYNELMKGQPEILIECLQILKTMLTTNKLRHESNSK